MPPRLPLRCQLHDNCQQQILKSTLRRRPRRSFSSTFAASEYAETSAEHRSAPTTTPYVQDEHQTWRLRVDGKRKLPLPPILDPIAISQRDRWIEPKKPAAAPADRTAFQKKLHNNAFAHMLSAPIRVDRRLNVVLPSSFLVPFRPLRHPSTDEIWLLPGSELKPTKAAGSFNAWALARREHLRALGNTKKNAYRGLTGHEQGAVMSQGSTRHRGEAAWRTDMDDVVLRLLRERVVKLLRYGFGKPRGNGVVQRLWEDPRKPFVPYTEAERGERAVGERVGEEGEKEGEEANSTPTPQPTLSLPSQLSLHAPPAALLLLRPLQPLSAAPLDAVRESLQQDDLLVNTLVHHKKIILKHFYPTYTPGPHSMWAYIEHVQPRLAPTVRFGRCRPHVVRWTGNGNENVEDKSTSQPTVGELPQASPHQQQHRAEHSRLVPVYSLPDLLGGDDAVAALLGGEPGERLWGRGAVVLKAGPGSIGALTALERLRSYVEVPW